jgi:hypothetical protein
MGRARASEGKAPSGRGLPSGSEDGGENLRLLFSPSVTFGDTSLVRGRQGLSGTPAPTKRRGVPQGHLFHCEGTPPYGTITDGAVEAQMEATAA